MWYIVSAGFEEEHNCVFLKLYNSETCEIRRWLDDSGFLPYLLTDAPPHKLGFKVVKKTEQMVKFDALKNIDKKLTKVMAEHPRHIGGRYQHRDILKYAIPEETGHITWEDDIPIYLSFIYDNDIGMGLPHTITQNKLVRAPNTEAEARVNALGKLFDNDSNILTWARIMEYPAPDFKRLAIDAEILNTERRVPDPKVALLPVITVCCVDNHGRKIALVLDQHKGETKEIPEDHEIIMFSKEIELLKYLFNLMKEYPFIITFNGDDFDLQYLKQRGLNLGLCREDMPIERYKNTMFLKHGIHIDLYKFFSIRAIQIYSFKGKYKNVDLNSVGKALIKKEKLRGEKRWVGDMTTDELVKYCMRDAEITMELTTFADNLVMNLILVLSRISRLPMENVSRLSISRWIKSYMYYDHRQRGYLIPKSDDLVRLKGSTATEAIIKGKKYKGAIVVDPVAGVHFNTGVVDFQSLYPSILKEHNLGYQTINCSHEECKTNTVPNTPHWVCTRTKAIESIFVGGVRDLRVLHYKKKAKDNTLTKAEKSWYSAVEQSLKVIMNASYGVFGDDDFVLYCPPVAESVTAYGRYSIISTAKKAKEMGIDVLYGDTDSVFLHNFTKEQIRQLRDWSDKELKMDLDLEKTYRFVCLSGRKKNYVGVITGKDGEEDEVDVKGMTGKKKHTPHLFRTNFDKCKKILKQVHTPEEFKQAKSAIEKVVLDTYNAIKRRQWESLEDIAFHYNMGKGIEEYGKKTKAGKMSYPQHVKVAIMLRDAGYDVESGQTIAFIKTKKIVSGKRGIRYVDDVKPLELATNKDVNTDKYIDFLKSTFNQLLDPMGIEFDSIIGLKKLDSFFEK